MFVTTNVKMVTIIQNTKYEYKYKYKIQICSNTKYKIANPGCVGDDAGEDGDEEEKEGDEEPDPASNLVQKKFISFFKKLKICFEIGGRV